MALERTGEKKYHAQRQATAAERLDRGEGEEGEASNTNLESLSLLPSLCPPNQWAPSQKRPERIKLPTIYGLGTSPTHNFLLKSTDLPSFLTSHYTGYVDVAAAAL